MIAALLLAFIWSTTQTTSGELPAPPAALVFENGFNDQYQIIDGAIALSDGRGWLRTREPFSNFIFTFEVLASAPNTDAVLGLRSWPTGDGWPKRGYALNLSGPKAGVVAGRKEAVVTFRPAEPIAVSDGEWQAVTVTCIGSQVTVGWNRALTSRVQLPEHTPTGFLIFSVKKGAIRIRNATIRELPLDAALGEPVYRPKVDPGITAPTVLKAEKVRYSLDAIQRKVSGTVELEAIVLKDGSVGPLRVVKSLDIDLDVEALSAVRRWRFKPATLNGAPVAMLARFELTFTLKQ